MVEMYDWGEFLKAERVTMAGMRRPVKEQRMWPGFGLGHRTLLKPEAHSGNITWNAPVRHRDQSYTKIPGTGYNVPFLHWFQRQQDRYRLLQMWRNQQQQLRERAASDKPGLPPGFSGKDNPGHAREFIWKPGDPFYIHTPEGAMPAHPKGESGKGPIMGLQGGLVMFLNKLIGVIPGLRDPSDRQAMQARVESTEKGQRALAYFHRQRARNPDWQMSDADRTLVANMMFDFYTQDQGMDPAAARMVARGAHKWDQKTMEAVHQGLSDYQMATSSGIPGEPVRPYGEKEMKDVEEIIEGNLEAAKGKSRSKKQEFNPDTDWGQAAVGEMIDYDLEQEDLRRLFHGFQPTRAAAGDDPTAVNAGWEKNAAALHELRKAIIHHKKMLHKGANSHDTPLQNMSDLSLNDFYAHENSPFRQYLTDPSVTPGEKRNRRHAQQVMAHIWDGYEDGEPANSKVVNNITGFILGHPDHIQRSVTDHPDAFPVWNAGKPATYFGPEPPIGGPEQPEELGSELVGDGE